MNQQTNPELAKDPPTAKPQTQQPETKRQVLTGALFTQRPQETPAVTIEAPLKFNRPPKVSFYFRESLYGINVLLTLFLHLEVSIMFIK